MKSTITINDVPAFAEASELLHSLENERVRLTSECAMLCKHLTGDTPGDGVASPTPEEVARAILNGEVRPPSNKNAEWRERQLVARERLIEVGRAIDRLLVRRELIRERARTAQLAADSRVGEIRKAMAAAEMALRAVIASEDALLDDLVRGGFGRIDPIITAPFWLRLSDREWLMGRPV